MRMIIIEIYFPLNTKYSVQDQDYDVLCMHILNN